MKKALIFLLCLLFTFSAVACKSTGDEGSTPAGQSSTATSESDDESNEPEDSSEPAESKTPSDLYDALMAKTDGSDTWFMKLSGDIAGLEVTMSFAVRNGIVSFKTDMLDTVQYAITEDGKTYSFTLDEPYYTVSDAEENMFTDDSVFVSEGTKEKDGKTLSYVIRRTNDPDIEEELQQAMTFYFDGEDFYAISMAMPMGEDASVEVTLKVEVFNEEIPLPDMLFEVPEDYTEFDIGDDFSDVSDDPTGEAEFPDELPAFTAGTLFMAAPDENNESVLTFAYIGTEQKDCDTYVKALKDADFAEVDTGDIAMDGVVTMMKGKTMVAVYFTQGVTAISYKADVTK